MAARAVAASARPEWPQPIGFDHEHEVLEVKCELCGERRVMSASVDEGSVAESREHWEHHVDGMRPIPYFHLPGIGDLKQASSGTWANVLRAIPYLLPEGAPKPPFDVANEILAKGLDDAGMSGGCRVAAPTSCPRTSTPTFGMSSSRSVTR